MAIPYLAKILNSSIAYFFFFFFCRAACETFPGGSAGKESICNAGDLGSVSGLGRSPGEGKGYPL